MSRVVVEDTFKHKGLRQQLINLLKEKGITDENVLSAMNNIPRHFFLDLAFDKIAYEDRAFPIGEGQTISHPYTVAFQSQLLMMKDMLKEVDKKTGKLVIKKIQPREKVLEVGTGSVYQATVLAEMGAMVYTIERQKKLYDKNIGSYPFLTKYKNIHFFYGDGFAGLPQFAPFDKIIITAAAPFIPEKLIDQLKPGGVFVLPIGEDENHQVMTRIIKQQDGSLVNEEFDSFSFVPMLKGRQD